MAIVFRARAVMVFDSVDTAVLWKNGLKNKVIQVRDAGIFPAFESGRIEIDQYFIGGTATADDATPWAPQPPPE